MIYNFQQVGMMNEEQKAVTAYLIKVLNPKDQKDFENKIAQLSETDLKEYYKQFKTMENNQISIAKLGAKLNYLQTLRGECPEGYEVEKLIITLSSSIYKDLQKDFKIKLDENKARLDIDLETKEYVTKDQRRNVNISILLPIHYIHKLECDVLPTSMSVSHIHSDSIELDIKTSSLKLMDISGHIEINCNIDMVFTIDAIHEKLDLNSVRCSSQLNITSSCLFNIITKGIKTKIIYAGDIDEDSGNQIELNGIMSELAIKAD